MLRFGSLLLLFLTLAPSVSHAQAPGIRFGFTDDPDLIFLGGHLAFQGIGNVPEIRIEPALELGIGDNDDGPFDRFGDDYYGIRFGANGKYFFDLGNSGFYAYPLLGVSLYYYDFENCENCDDVEAGLNLGGGFEYEGFAFDLYLGIADIPDITFAFLYTF